MARFFYIGGQTINKMSTTVDVLKALDEGFVLTGLAFDFEEQKWHPCTVRRFPNGRIVAKTAHDRLEWGADINDLCDRQQFRDLVAKRRKAWRIATALLVAPLILASCTMTTGITASGPLDGPRTGKASATALFGFVVAGDASIATAARNGGIIDVRSVDHRTTNVLGIFKRYTVILTGK